MTSRIGGAARAKVIARLTGKQGVNAGLAALNASGGAAESLEASHVRAVNAAPDILERTSGGPYPAMLVYCEKIVNSLAEKFRTFSGTVRMTVEIRHSQDGLEGLQERLELYADAVARTLDASRGDLGDGMFYGGGYEISFGPVKPGGKNLVQPAKVTFDIAVSRS